MAELNLRIEKCTQVKQTYIVSLEGIIDSLTVDMFRGEIESVIQKNSPHTLILDMAELIFINSVGIGVIFEIAEKLKSCSGKIVFTHLRPNIDDTFSVMGIRSIFPVYDSNQEAFEVLEKTQK